MCIVLLWQRTVVARLLFVYLLLWLLLFKLRFILLQLGVEGSYQTCGENAVVVAGAWVLYAWFATDWDRRRLGFATGDMGVRVARVLYGLSYFAYVNLTAPLVPCWLPWHVGRAYFTGAAYLAAGIAVLIGVCTAAWVVADSYRGTPWLTIGER
jgi:hypothetical protein